MAGVTPGDFGWDCSAGGTAPLSHRSYGAYAATSDTGTFFGYAIGQPSRAQAERLALASCNKVATKGQSCMLAGWFTNACAALAVAPNGAWGSEWSESKIAAERRSLDTCVKLDEDHTGQCKLMKSLCTY